MVERAVNIKIEQTSREREREREIYARRPCIVLQRGIVGRVPWCKDYTDPLPYKQADLSVLALARGILIQVSMCEYLLLTLSPAACSYSVPGSLCKWWELLCSWYLHLLREMDRTPM